MKAAGLGEGEVSVGEACLETIEAVRVFGEELPCERVEGR